MRLAEVAITRMSENRIEDHIFINRRLRAANVCVLRDKWAAFCHLRLETASDVSNLSHPPIESIFSFLVLPLQSTGGGRSSNDQTLSLTRCWTYGKKRKQ